MEMEMEMGTVMVMEPKTELSQVVVLALVFEALQLGSELEAD